MTRASDSKGLAWWGPAVSAVTLALALVRLGGSTLWLDEALTGLLGSHILKFGLPRVEDGPILIHEVAGDSKDGLWIWDGWLQFYLSAAGQAIFGQTAFGARFFHALAGALIPWAAYPLFRAMSSRRGVAEAAVLLTGLSVPLLLSARQAHYYPEGTLLTILVIRAYHGVLESRRFATPALAAVSVLLFHCHSVWFVALGTAFAAHILILRPTAPVFGRLAVAALSALIIVAPYALWTKAWVRVEHTGQEVSAFNYRYVFLGMVRHYLLELGLYGAPVVLLCLGGAASAGLRRPIVAIACLIGALAGPIVLFGPHTAVELWSFAAVWVLFLLLGAAILLREAGKPREVRGWMPGALVALIFLPFILLPAGVRYLALTRYVIPLFPLLAFLTAAAVFAIFRWQALCWAVVALLVTTNAVSVWPVQYVSEHASVTRTLFRYRTPQELNQIRLPPWVGLPRLSIAAMTEFWKPLTPPELSVRIPLRDYLTEFTQPTLTPAGVVAEYINGRKRPGDRFAHPPRNFFPITFHTGLAPAPMVPGSDPPRFLVLGPPGAYPARIVKDWMTRRTYRKIVLRPDVGPFGPWPEPDSHYGRAVDKPKDVVLWERLDNK